jgi:two-component system, chemotaxis family, chemotaxis protein CheY
MAANAFEKLKVVIVDDSKHMRQLLHAVLFAFGFKNVHEAPNGKSGFFAVQAIKPDFVLTDFAMSPVDGAEFVKMVRSLHGPIAWVPIIMITGHGERQYIERARDAGITELLCKPISPRDLYSRIVEVVERPRPFVTSPAFVGPDRRRQKIAGLFPKRRQADREVELEFR